MGKTHLSLSFKQWSQERTYSSVPRGQSILDVQEERGQRAHNGRYGNFARDIELIMGWELADHQTDWKPHIALAQDYGN